jgi:hypothetical protein
MRSEADIREVFRLLNQQLPLAEIARRTSVSRAQIRSWRRAGIGATLRSPMRTTSTHDCPGRCPRRATMDADAYAYLLGQYLGDGCISRLGRSYKMRISCCDAYPGIMDEVERALVAVVPNRVSRQQRIGCTEVGSHSTHWPCLFPQHGPGVKHRRPQVLEDWQVDLALDGRPALLLRGLIHSDGWRGTNRVSRHGRTYEYPRYLFCNESADIRAIFTAACERLGIDCRPNNRNSISVARRASVERLDTFVGPKS